MYISLSGHLLGNSCSLGFRYVYLVSVSDLLIYFFPTSVFNGNFFLIAPFPDHCLLLPFFKFILVISLIRRRFLVSAEGKRSLIPISLSQKMQSTVTR